MSEKKSSLWIKADSTHEEVYPAGNKWTLAEMQAKVGGYIELIANTQLADGQIAFVDEDGLMKRLPKNTRGSMLLGRPIVGNLLVVPKGQVE